MNITSNSRIIYSYNFFSCFKVTGKILNWIIQKSVYNTWRLKNPFPGSFFHCWWLWRAPRRLSPDSTSWDLCETWPGWGRGGPRPGGWPPGRHTASVAKCCHQLNRDFKFESSPCIGLISSETRLETVDSSHSRDRNYKNCSPPQEICSKDPKIVQYHFKKSKLTKVVLWSILLNYYTHSHKNSSMLSNYQHVDAETNFHSCTLTC